MKNIVTVSVLHMDEYYEYEAQNWPQEGDKVLVEYLGSTPGGSVANFSFVSAAFGAPVSFFDTMSTSETSSKLLEEMEKVGIDTSMVNRLPDLEDGKCMIFSSSQERTIIGIMKPRPVLPLTKEQRVKFENAGIIYTSMGWHNLITDVLQNFKSFQAKGALVALDVEQHFPGEEDKMFMENADILFFNQFGFAKNRGERSEEDYIHYLFDQGVNIIALTLGERGCRVYARPDVCIEMPAYDVEVVDTNGAGDTFNASFIYGLLQEWALEKVVRFAIGASNYAITQPGPRGGAVPIGTISEFMKKHGHYL